MKIAAISSASVINELDYYIAQNFSDEESPVSTGLQQRSFLRISIPVASRYSNDQLFSRIHECIAALDWEYTCFESFGF